MLSATDHPDIQYTLPPAALQSPAMAEAWANSLPEAAQKLLADRARVILNNLPSATKADLVRTLVAAHVPVPPELSNVLSGLGYLSDDGYGGAIAALIGAGTALYSSHQTISAANSMNNASLSTDQNIAAMNNQAYVQSTQIMADVQALAAQTAGQASVAQTQLRSQATVAVLPKVMVGLAVLAAIGVGGYVYSRRKGRK